MPASGFRKRFCFVSGGKEDNRRRGFPVHSAAPRFAPATSRVHQQRGIGNSGDLAALTQAGVAMNLMSKEARRCNCRRH